VVWQQVSPAEQKYMNEVLHAVSLCLIISQCHLFWSSQHWFCRLRMSLQLVVSCLHLTDQFAVTVLWMMMWPDSLVALSAQHSMLPAASPTCMLQHCQCCATCCLLMYLAVHILRLPCFQLRSTCWRAPSNWVAKTISTWRPTHQLSFQQKMTSTL